MRLPWSAQNSAWLFEIDRGFRRQANSRLTLMRCHGSLHPHSSLLRSVSHKTPRLVVRLQFCRRRNIHRLNSLMLPISAVTSLGRTWWVLDSTSISPLSDMMGDGWLAGKWKSEVKWWGGVAVLRCRTEVFGRLHFGMGGCKLDLQARGEPWWVR